MNKAAGIGIVIIIIAVIIGVAYSMSSSGTNDSNLPVIEEEIIDDKSEHAGTDYSVELTEDMGLKTP